MFEKLQNSENPFEDLPLKDYQFTIDNCLENVKLG